MSKQQKDVAFEITKIITSNEEPSNWEANASDYINNPKDKNPNIVSDIQDIAAEHALDIYTASILYHSKK